jgi:peroxiredoxin
LDARGKSDLDDKLLQAEWLLAAGKGDEALELVAKEIDSKPGEVLPVAVMSWLKHRTGSASSAQESFEQLRHLASTADLDTPLLARLLPLAAELGYEEKWSLDYTPAADAGERPDLDSLGPFRWQPYLAPNFSVESAVGETLTLTRLGQRPTIVIFYLGFGCLHCVEQLHAFSPRANEFRSQGIEVLAISSEDRKTLSQGLASYSKPLELPLYTDPKLTAFKSYRCYDDFEQQPLHGTFLIDPDGRVLWQDISYEPFMDVDFCLAESRRLLTLAGYEKYLAPVQPETVVTAKQ